MVWMGLSFQYMKTKNEVNILFAKTLKFDGTNEMERTYHVFNLSFRMLPFSLVYLLPRLVVIGMPFVCQSVRLSVTLSCPKLHSNVPLSEMVCRAHAPATCTFHIS